ncbi:MAG: TIGR02281 family clan AA aspartic protease [Amaricoccus sp.]
MPLDGLSPDDKAHLVYLVLLLVMVVVFFAAGRRRNLVGWLRDLLAWILIFLMVLIAYQASDSIRAALFPPSTIATDGAIELLRQSDGHFHAELEVNGHPVRFMVDTGASQIVLSRRDAEAVGLDPDRLVFADQAETANGWVPIAPVRLREVRFGGMQTRGVPASVSAGALDMSLLGMDYLRRFARIEIEGDVMRLRYQRD